MHWEIATNITVGPRAVGPRACRSGQLRAVDDRYGEGGTSRVAVERHGKEAPDVSGGGE